MNLIELIDELDDELGGKRGLFNRRVDISRCIGILDEIKRVLPATLGEAEQILLRREQILENADTVAKNVIKEAEERALHLSDSSEVMRLAERKGREALERTYRQCDALVQKTKEHLDSVFVETETFLRTTLDTVKVNRNELREAITHSAQ